MNYFTREELEDITTELLENPARETLKKLNEKYNGSVIETPAQETPIVEEAPIINEIQAPVMEESSASVINEVPQVAPLPEIIPVVNENVVPVVAAPAFEIPNVEVPKVENNANNVSLDIPNFELPKLESSVVNNQNNQPINFSGNLFETSSQPVANLMQTTDNFNSVPSTMPSTEVPVSPVPFFGPHAETVSNPIPVGGPTNTMPNMGPTMFGQLQQNYM